MTDRWKRLQFGHIVGVVDSYGAVHSEFTGEAVAFHSEHFPPANVNGDGTMIEVFGGYLQNTSQIKNNMRPYSDTSPASMG